MNLIKLITDLTKLKLHHLRGKCSTEDYLGLKQSIHNYHAFVSNMQRLVK
jgi:hypothetical protein